MFQRCSVLTRRFLPHPATHGNQRFQVFVAPPPLLTLVRCRSQLCVCLTVGLPLHLQRFGVPRGCKKYTLASCHPLLIETGPFPIGVCTRSSS